MIVIGFVVGGDVDVYVDIGLFDRGFVLVVIDYVVGMLVWGGEIEWD